MRIKSAQVTNYRSVIDSTSFEVEPDKTILVGINEAGKTAVLRALESINASPDVPKLDYLRDYPRARLNDIQRGTKKPSQIQVAQATFSLDDSDRAALSDSLQLAPDATITWHRYLDNSLKYSLHGFPSPDTAEKQRTDVVRLRAYIAKQEDAPATLLASLDTISEATGTLDGSSAVTFRKALADALPLIDEDDTKEMERWTRLDQATSVSTRNEQAKEILRKRLPRLVYYSTYFTVRPRIDLESLASRIDQGDIDNEYDFGNLCLLKVLGFTARELSDLGANAPVKPAYYESNVDVRKGHDEAIAQHQRQLDDRSYRLNAASVQLTSDIRRVWGDDQVTLRIVADGQYLKVVVVDDLGVEVELDQRSEGFRWLVSFFVVFRAQASDQLEGAILLLDEPGLSLHALKQQEFRKTVSLLGEDNQIIYSTHSPFMIGSDELDRVRIAEMTDRKSGTKVHTRLQVDDPKSIYPLQAALGYELAQSMFVQKKNLVCEGVTDMFYINATNEAAEAAGAAVFKSKPAVIPAGTASKVAYFVTIYNGQKLDVAALLDSDAAGDAAAAQDSLVALLPKKGILRVNDFLQQPIKAAEIEDLFRETLIQVAKGLGWDVEVKAKAQPNRPLVDILTDEFKKDFSKWKLARGFSRWLIENGYDALSDDERAAWNKLAVAVDKALN